MELAKDLHVHFARVVVAGSAMELRTVLLRHEARVAVLDVELLEMNEIRELARTFEELTIICTHRSPDERMWMESLRAGAVEFCHPLDLRSILRASRTAVNRHLTIAA
jgi:DNA-binding NtrC family response regulator